MKSSASESKPVQSRSKDEIPGQARRKERLSRSKLKQAFLIDSDAELFMYLIQCIRFGSWKVRRLNRALHGEFQLGRDGNYFGFVIAASDKNSHSVGLFVALHFPYVAIKHLFCLLYHQTLHFFLGFIGDPNGQLNAFENSGMFLNVPLTLQIQENNTILTKRPLKGLCAATFSGM